MTEDPTPPTAQKLCFKQVTCFLLVKVISIMVRFQFWKRWIFKRWCTKSETRRMKILAHCQSLFFSFSTPWLPTLLMLSRYPERIQRCLFWHNTTGNTCVKRSQPCISIHLNVHISQSKQEKTVAYAILHINPSHRMAPHSSMVSILWNFFKVFP